MKIKKLFLTIFLIVIMVALSGGGVQAALQSNPNTQYNKKDTLSDWMTLMRQMEASDGAMGLSETIETDLTPSTSNGIDVHCMKTTEYGAIAILSASAYGNPSNDQAITTTTGNNTGIILDTAQWEMTASSLSSSGITGINARYYDLYTTDENSAKRGDALGSEATTNPGCTGWHSASRSVWAVSFIYNFKRGNGGIFSYSTQQGSQASRSDYARAVAVCGTGL